MSVYTVEDIMSLDPCEDYPRWRVSALWAGRESLSAREIAALDIPPEDRIWALTRLVTSRTVRLFACDCAERSLKRVVDAGGSTDPRSWDAIITSRLYADGDRTYDDLRAAWSAARSSSLSSADYAADSAAYCAAAGSAAAWYSVYCAAGSTELAWQLRLIVERMEADNA